MDWANFLSSLTGIIIGGIITWLVSKRYYKRASRDLKNETEGLRKLIVIILEGLENHGLMEIVRDEKGNIIAYKFRNITFSDTAKFSDSVMAQVKTEKPG